MIILVAIIPIISSNFKITEAAGGTLPISSWAELADLNNHLNEGYVRYYLTNNLTTTDSDYVGIGDAWSPIGNTTNCYNGEFDGAGFEIRGMKVSSASDYAGLFGCLDSSYVHNLGISNADVDGANYTGVLSGAVRNGATVSQVFTTGTVTGGNQTGGLVGTNEGGSSILDSYSRANITMLDGSGNVGGLVGYNKDASSITNTYSTGSGAIGGLVGTNDTGGTINSSFWDTETSGISGVGNGVGLATLAMNTETTFTDAAWDFGSTWDINGVSKSRNDGYPYLKWQVFDKVLIYNWTGLKETSDDLSANYVLANDLKTTNSDYIGIGDIWVPDTQCFTGTLDGGGFTIDGLTVDSTSDNIGLFGCLNSAAISKIGLTNVNIRGAHYVGAIAGSINNGSQITESYATGSVVGLDGAYDIGGLVGVNENDSSVTNSYSKVDVTIVGAAYDKSIGGLVGENYTSGTLGGNIVQSYSTGSGALGGLLGMNSAGTTDSSFWDTQTSAQPVSDGGTGKTTLEMKTKNTFIDANWDFTNIWDIDVAGVKNDGYPYLRWQKFASINSSDPSDPNENVTSDQEKQANPPVFVKLSNTDNRLINIDENEVITTNPFLIKVKPIDDNAIEKVDFYVGDVLIGTDWHADMDGFYEYPWDTSKYHSAVKVVAYNTRGLSTVLANINTTVNLTGITTLPQTGMDIKNAQ